MTYRVVCLLSILAMAGALSCQREDSESASPPSGWGQGGTGGGAADAASAGMGGKSAASGGSAGSTAGSGGAVVLVSALVYPARVAVDSKHVYFTEVGTFKSVTEPAMDGKVARVPIAGGVVDNLTSGTRLAPLGLTIDASNAFLVSLVEGQAQGTLMRVAKAGGAVSKLDDGANPSFLAQDSSPGSNANNVLCGKVDDIVAWPVSATAPLILGSGNGSVSGVATDGTDVYWGDMGETVDGAPGSDGKLMRVGWSGSPAAMLIDRVGAPVGIALDATHVYVADGKGGDVWKVSKDGTGAQKLAIGQAAPWAIAVDDTHVYWTNRGAATWSSDTCAGKGSVMRSPKEPGSVQAIASGRNCPEGISLDGSSVYWAEAGSAPATGARDGAIMKLAK